MQKWQKMNLKSDGVSPWGGVLRSIIIWIFNDNVVVLGGEGLLMPRKIVFIKSCSS